MRRKAENLPRLADAVVWDGRQLESLDMDRRAFDKVLATRCMPDAGAPDFLRPCRTNPVAMDAWVCIGDEKSKVPRCFFHGVARL